MSMPSWQVRLRGTPLGGRPSRRDPLRSIEPADGAGGGAIQRSLLVSDSGKVGRAPGDQPEATWVYRELLGPCVLVLDLARIETPVSCLSCQNRAAIKGYERGCAPLLRAMSRIL